MTHEWHDQVGGRASLVPSLGTRLGVGPALDMRTLCRHNLKHNRQLLA